jgi:hypothetical protein
LELTLPLHTDQIILRMFLGLLNQLLYIRIKQFIRLFEGIDFIRLFFFLALILVITLMLFGWSSNRAYVAFWVPCQTLLFIGIHISRKDKDFIRMITKWPAFIFFTEYFLLSLPVIIFFILHKNWTGLLVIPCLFLPSLIYTQKRFSFSGAFRFLLAPFKTNNRLPAVLGIGTGNPLLFEWNSGLRQVFLFLGFIYLIILCFSFKGYVAHIGIILISFFISGFYFYGEPRQFIENFSGSAKEFLKRKILLNFKYLGILFLPIALVSLIFETKMWYLLIIAIIIGFIIQFLSIIIKYGLFHENSDLERNALILYTSVIGVLLPFLWPLPVIMGIRYYRKAIHNLTPYFHGNY